MICLRCAAVVSRTTLGACPRCRGPLVSVTPESIEQLVAVRMRRRVDGWASDHALDAETAERLRATLPPEPVAPPKPSLEARADALLAAAPDPTSWTPGWLTALREAFRERPDEHAAAEHQPDDGGGTGGALFPHAHDAVTGGADAFSALDSPALAGLKPLLNEYVWWFIGTLLVLGGSVMGVREAWRTLEGAPRQLIVAGAFLGYHAAFVGLSAVVARKSAAAGRVLAAIGLALLPIAFAALSSLMPMSPLVGVVAAAGASGVAFATVRAASRRYEGTPSLAFLVALFPSLWAELPLSTHLPVPARMALPLVGIGAVWWVARRGYASKEPVPSAFETVLAALYAALALGLFGLVGVPAESALDLSMGGAGFASVALWAVLLGGALAGSAGGEKARRAWPRAAAVIEVGSLAVAACAAVASAAGGLQRDVGTNPLLDVLFALLPMVAAAAFATRVVTRRAAVHPAVVLAFLSGALLARLEWPAQPERWAVGVAAMTAILLFVAPNLSDRRLRVFVYGWATLGTLGSTVLAALLDSGAGQSVAVALCGGVVAVAAHAVGGRERSGTHYLGGYAATMAALWWVGPTQVDPSAGRVWAYVAVAAAYGLAGRLHDRGRVGHRLQPLDDVSTVTGLVGAAAAIVSPTWAASLLNPTFAELAEPAAGLAMGFVLLVRAFRDESRLVSGAGALAVLMGLAAASGANTAAELAYVFGALGLGAATLAAARGAAVVRGGRGRGFLEGLPLPAHATGRPLLTDGFALAALFAAATAAANAVLFLLNIDDAQRLLAIEGGALAIGVALLAFLSTGFVSFGMRGAFATLAFGGGLVVVTALVNRLGRPLPPQVIGFKFLFIVPAVWLVAVALRRFGPALGRRLGNEKDGALYHLVPHAGVAALGLVLVVDALLLAAPNPLRALTVVPPLLLVGGALAAFLLARSAREALLFFVGLCLLVPAFALAAAQRAVLGPELVALVPPGSQWVRAELFAASQQYGWLSQSAWLAPADGIVALLHRFTFGVAAAAALFGGLGVLTLAGLRPAFSRLVLGDPSLTKQEQPFNALALASAGSAGLAALVSLELPDLPAAALVLVAGIGLVCDGRRRLGLALSGLAFLLGHHAVVASMPVSPDWAGPSLAAVALAMVAFARGKPEAVRFRLHLGAFVYTCMAALHALATGGQPDPANALLRLLFDVFNGLGGEWMRHPALALTSALAGAALLLGATEWKGALSKLAAAWGEQLLAFAALTGVAFAFGGNGTAYGPLVTVAGAGMALAVALSAAAAHAGFRLLSSRRADVSVGLGVGRDATLVEAGILLAWVSGSGATGTTALVCGAVALGLVFATSVHAAWTGRTGRHVWFAEIAVVGAYSLVSSQLGFDLPPEADSVFALVFGFVLVGVTVLARRRGVAPVAASTRRFAALLPVFVAVLMPTQASREAALLAAGSGLLYGALAAAERSRLFGSLAAVAANLALLILALAEGLDGVEIFLAPLGLLLLVLTQIFRRTLASEARTATRLLGGLLLYAPAAAKLSLQLGRGASADYSILFGALCIVGVGAGMLLQIRAYLAMGTLFLTLDVISNLVNAGLRDHRIGFVVLSASGLVILGAMVFTTFKREQVRAAVAFARRRISGWD